MLREACATCRAPLEPLWQLCPYCASSIEPSRANLDAALTAEMQKITLVDDTVPLVPQAEPRVADALKNEVGVARATPTSTCLS
jgi:hypothetical protein